MSDDFKLDAETEYQYAIERVRELEKTVDTLKKVIKENDLQDEIPEIDCSSVEEQLCLDGIRHIAHLVKTHQYTDKDIKSFDTLYKNLRIMNGQSDDESSKKQKPMKVGDLLKIVEGKK